MDPPPPWILLLQNGLGGEERIAAAAPQAVVLGGICDISCSRLGPAHVCHDAYGLMRLDPLQDSTEARLACAAVADDWGLRTLELLSNPALRQRLLTVMEEVVAAATADGAQLEEALLPTFLSKTEAMVSDTPSMQLDAEAGRPLELEVIYREPLRRAPRHGVAMPETTRLLKELEAL